MSFNPFAGGPSPSGLGLYPRSGEDGFSEDQKSELTAMIKSGIEDSSVLSKLLESVADIKAHVISKHGHHNFYHLQNKFVAAWMPINSFLNVASVVIVVMALLSLFRFYIVSMYNWQIVFTLMTSVFAACAVITNSYAATVKSNEVQHRKHHLTTAQGHFYLCMGMNIVPMIAAWMFQYNFSAWQKSTTFMHVTGATILDLQIMMAYYVPLVIFLASSSAMAVSTLVAGHHILRLVAFTLPELIVSSFVELSEEAAKGAGSHLREDVDPYAKSGPGHRRGSYRRLQHESIEMAPPRHHGKNPHHGRRSVF